MSGRCETDGDIVVIEYNWLNPFSGLGLLAKQVRITVNAK